MKRGSRVKGVLNGQDFTGVVTRCVSAYDDVKTVTVRFDSPVRLLGDAVMGSFNFNHKNLKEVL